MSNFLITTKLQLQKNTVVLYFQNTGQKRLIRGHET